VAAPVDADAPDRDPDQPIASAEPRARAGAQRDGQLLPEEQVLEREVTPRSQQGAQRASEES
jgi:hypothetical protein